MTRLVVYIIDSIFLIRMSPQEIQQGEVVVNFARFLKRLAGKMFFRIGVFIEGNDGEMFVRKTQASNFAGVDFYIYQGEVMVEDNLQEFVFRRFAELRAIRTNIKKEDALWRADLTTVFVLPDDERTKLCGFRAPMDQ